MVGGSAGVVSVSVSIAPRMQFLQRSVHREHPYPDPENQGASGGLSPLSMRGRGCEHSSVESSRPQSQRATETATRADPWDLYRRRRPRVIAGVAGGLADRLGVDDGYVRAAFVTLSTVWGIGVLLYLGIWMLTLDREDQRPPKPTDPRQRVGLALAFVGALWLSSAIGLVPDSLATAVFAAVSFGVAALWDRSESQSIVRVIVPGSGGGVSVFRILAGLGLLVGGLGLLFTTVERTTGLGITFLAVAVTVAGFVVAFGPWMMRLANDLSRERRERVRQEERSEVAAHLHDSVLQTLTLIQRAEDPRTMAALARTQERELRAWLYGRAPVEGADLLSTALETAAAKVEDEHHVKIDFVKVGEATLDDRGRSLVAATTEAMVNSAKHGGTGTISVYLEVDGTTADVWVTDQGKGFDLVDVPSDRKGLEESVVGRMVRNGGNAEVASRLGEGTEVHLVMPGLTAQRGET